MTSDTPRGPEAEAVGELIASFLDSVRSSVEQLPADQRAAELFYELDQAVSHYLEEHQLSPDCHHALQQDLLHGLADCLPQRDEALAFDSDAESPAPVDAAQFLAAFDGYLQSIKVHGESSLDSLASYHDPVPSPLDLALPTTWDHALDGCTADLPPLG